MILTTAPQTLAIFFTRQIRHLRHCGYSVQVITSPGPELDGLNEELPVPVHAVPMCRSISPFRDVVAFFRILRVLRRVKPHLVQTHTPKAGLLGISAAAFLGVPVRIFTVNGFVWESAAGWRRRLLRLADQWSARVATRILCVSESLRKVAMQENIFPFERCSVLGSGGSHGVDLSKFDPAGFTPELRMRFRTRQRIESSQLVLAFIGRFVSDKGIETLHGAWREIRKLLPNAILLLVGERELTHPVPESLWIELTEDDRVRQTRLSLSEMPCVYSIADMVILPTRREGLPNVLLEAAAMEVPVIATRVTGCVDVVRDGVTGFLFPVGDVPALVDAVLRLAGSEELRRTFGTAARSSVAAFSEATVSGALALEYDRLLRQAGF